MADKREQAHGSQEGVLQQIAPYLEQVADAVDKVSPYIVQAGNACEQGWQLLQPYKPKEWGPTLFGLLLVFFGGRFLTTVAAFEAIRLIGVRSVLLHIDKLWGNYQAARDLAIKDLGKDGDKGGDTRADNGAISHETKRRVLTILKACDPNEVIEALGGLYGIILSVIATLRFKFAAAVTLGCSLGDIFSQSVHKYGKPALSRSVSPEYHKWIDPGITLLCQGLGVALAWMLQRVISALHCAVRGAHIVITQSQKAAVKLGFIAKPFLTEDSPVFSLVVMLLAAVGFLNQVQYGFSMPLLLQPFFLPMYVIEFLLTQTIGSV